MAQKAESPKKKTNTESKAESKTVARKSVSPAAKSAAKKKYNAGDCLTCQVCGISVTVDENFAYQEESTLVCCGHPMKQKAKK
jgi:hypothetical protein